MSKKQSTTLEENYQSPRFLIKSLLTPALQKKQYIAFLIFGVFLISFAESILLLLSGPFLKALFFAQEGGTIAGQDIIPHKVTEYFPFLKDFVLTKTELIYFVSCGILLSGIVKNIGAFLYQLHSEALSLFIAKDFRDRMFSKILTSPYLKISQKSPGEWMSCLMNDVFVLQMKFSEIVSNFLKEIATVLVAFSVILVIQWQIALCLVLFFPIVSRLMGKIAKTIGTYSQGLQKNLSLLVSHVFDVRKRFYFMKAQKGEVLEAKIFQEINHHYFALVKKSMFFRSIFPPAVELIGFLCFALIMLTMNFTSLFSVNNDHVIIFFTALGVMIKPLKNIGEQISKFQETKGALSNGLKIIFESKEESLRENYAAGFSHAWLKGEPAAQFAYLACGQRRPSGPLGPLLAQDEIHIEEIQLRLNPQWTFSTQKKTLRPGQTVSIVGPSGSGKSTLIKSLAGLIPPTQWTGNQRWEDIVQETSMVSQFPFLFNDSILDNLYYGSSHHNKSLEEKKLWNILNELDLGSVVKALPEGLHSPVKMLNANFSGGQIQRFAIARALLREKKLWLFDEATSAIDEEQEKRLIHFLLHECKTNKKILLMVTHRLKWLHLFDEVWFVEDGKITLQGTHQELIDQIPRYREFYHASG